MRGSKYTQGGEGDRVVVDDHVSLFGPGVEGDGANDGAGVSPVDCHIRLGAEETFAAHFYRVEDGSFVRAEDTGTLLRYA